MKKTILSIAMAVVFGGFASAATEPTEVVTKAVKTSESSVMWKAYKVTGSHSGLVQLNEGNLMFDGDVLVGGNFTVDMTSLIATDLEGDSKLKLEGHLKSEDFFGVENHPSSTLIFTEVKATGKNSYEVTGDLTIKGITKPVSFDLSIYGNKATAAVKIDRAEYNVRYGSGSFFDNLGDKTIYDEFDLVVDLQF